ncbi:hypothetical protein ACOSP7_000599 [Xanthoceras sorbifolium]|uniref:Uncharacterized protein n=1 Tax=Xanthoceras sorbifolium TaxID=99658 RepID=A0ABQ8INA2_9ROSI|nr:hypothetical protein JRO89_XS01G0352200 [Xanthoceras sorbifolium]
METEKLVDGGVCNGGEDHHHKEDKEDEKMEKFFSLIRSFHEARNRRRQELNDLEDKRKKNKIRRCNGADQQQSSSWVPSFEWQDFTEEIEFRRPPTIFPTPYNNKDLGNKKQRRQEEDGLDLKLTL